MEKINVAELLRNCPNGMELDCAMYDKVTLVGVDNSLMFPIKVRRKDGCLFTLTKYGQYCDVDYAKCVIFPKGKTTWEGFVPSGQFKDGDILSYQCTGYRNRTIYIYRHHPTMNTSFYVALDGDDLELMVSRKEGYALSGYNTTARLATKEEKQKLFDAIKANGYKWDAETKTLEKSNEPEFKNGDIVYATGGSIVILGDRVGKKHSESFHSRCGLFIDGFDTDVRVSPQRLATEEEKQKLFQAIKDNGYEWNAETKTLIPPFHPNFRKDDWVIDKQGLIHQIENVVENVTNHSFGYDIVGGGYFNDNSDVRLWTIQDAKDGDVLAINWYEGNDSWEKIVIFKKYHNNGVEGLINSPCVEGYGNTFKNGKLVFHEEVPYFSKTWTANLHPATKEQSDLLFQKMEESGYEYNTKTKTLNKLLKFKVGCRIKPLGSDKHYIIKDIELDRYVLNDNRFLKFTDEHHFELVFEPKFKIGDRIRHKNSGLCCILGEYSKGISAYRTDIGLSITYKDLEQWELAPHKFDIATLKPFDKVLVRDAHSQVWTADLFSHKVKEQIGGFVCIGHYWHQCIPYKGNEYLLGTNNDCNGFFKTW